MMEAASFLFIYVCFGVAQVSEVFKMDSGHILPDL